MRRKLISGSLFISAWFIFASPPLHSSWLAIKGATSIQDPNATLPSAKKPVPTTESVPPAKKSIPPPKKNNPPARTRRSTPPTNSSRAFRPQNPGIELVRIPAGRFTMGSTNGEAEKPAHQVTISYSFYTGKYEVTQAQWQAVMGNNPSSFKGDNLPVETVSWLDAQQFLQKLNQMNDGYTYRLPTEAEWEYAARAGTTTNYYWGEDVTQACRYANVADQTAKAKHPDWTIVECQDGYAETSPVGSFTPNAWGLFDIAGNVWEWCEDWYHPSYEGAPNDGSAWLSGGEQKYRMLRGGSWFYDASYLRSANRNYFYPVNRENYLGFRVVAVVEAGRLKPFFLNSRSLCQQPPRIFEWDR